MTPSEPVCLEELDRVGVVRHLTEEEAAALTDTRLVEVRPEHGGVWRLLPAGQVGAVRVSGLEVQVRPKTSIASLLFLLGYAADPGFRPEDVHGVPNEGLWPALGESLARQAERALGPGVLQSYVTADEALPLLRGRIRVADQIARRPGMVLPLEVRYDEYSPDTPENRLLRTAIRRMMTVSGLDPSVRARLAHLDGRLDGVKVLTPGMPLPSWRLTRLNARYGAALRLAQIVLQHQSAEPGAGGLTVAAFVVSMARVFEDFVTTALREALALYPGYTQGQYPDFLDESKDVPIRPDVVHIRSGLPVAVFDAKYKLEDSSSRYPNADLYQMLAYCTALGLDRGWLVYAQGTAPHHPVRIQNTIIEVVQYPLDLAVRPGDLLRQISRLADSAIRPASRSLSTSPGSTG